MLFSKAIDDSNYVAILDRMEWFAVWKDPASASATWTSTGKPALELAWSAMVATQDDADKKAQVKLAELEVFKKFKWLLTSSQQETLATWTKGAIQNQFGDKMVRASASSSSSSSAPSKQLKKKAPGAVEKNTPRCSSSLDRFRHRQSRLVRGWLVAPVGRQQSRHWGSNALAH